MIPADNDSGDTDIALPYASFTKPLNFENMRSYIQENYIDYNLDNKWDEVKMENMKIILLICAVSQAPSPCTIYLRTESRRRCLHDVNNG